MVSLVDIGPAKGTVPIRGQNIDVVGLTARDIITLFNRFPELRRVVTGKADAEIMQILFAELPHVLATIVAACMGEGKAEDKAEVEAAERLTMGEQWLIIKATMELTFPQSVTNFIDDLLALVGQKGGVSGWAQGMTSPVPSSDASGQVEQKPTASDQRPDNSTPGSS